MGFLRRVARPSRRIVIVLALQGAVVGLLAGGALGTSKTGLSAGAPKLTAGVDAAHDTSVRLDRAPHIALDPNRTIPEIEQQPPAGVSSGANDPVVQSAVAPAPRIASTTTSFMGIRTSALAVNYAPPDTVGDVGLTQYLQAVNGGIDVFSKTGDNLTGAITDDSFWSGLSPCDADEKTDPTVNYDQFANRWVYSEMAFSDVTSGPYYECVAVSTSDDATGSWYRYAFDLGTTYFPDYPKLGVWPDGYYLSFNDFDGGTTYRGVGALALQRSAMLSGASAQMVFFDLANVQTLPFGMLPADADGSTAPPNGAPELYAVPNDDASAANNDQLGVWAFHVDWSAPGGSTFTNLQNLNVAPFDGVGVNVPEPSPGSSLDSLANDQLMNRLQYRNFGGYQTLVTNETVDDSGADAPRWYELRAVNGVWSVNQQGTYAPDTIDRWMGSAAMNGLGDIALGYSAGDAATAPSLRFTGRLSTDALDTLQAENVLQAGGGVQTGTTRWGDYSQMSVDPSDDCTFWFTGEYYTATASSDWATRIGSMRIGSCTGPAGPVYTVVPAISGTATEGSTLTTTAGTWNPAPTSTSYQWRRCDTNGLSCVDIPNATTSSYTLQAADAGQRIRVKVTVSGGSGTSSIVSASTATILPLAPVNTDLPAITGTARLGQTLAATNGSWTSALTPTYSYQWLRCASGCAAIAGANGSSYSLTNSGDVGATIEVRVTATNAGGSASAISPATLAVQQASGPVNTVLPVVSGVAAVGSTLTVGNGTWTSDSPISYTYQWQTCSVDGTTCTPITGETNAAYAVASDDLGNRLRAVVTATNSGGGTTVNTALTSVIVEASGGSTGGGSTGGGSTGGGSTGGGSTGGGSTSSGGGGGGTGGALNLSVTGSESSSAPAVGSQVLYSLQVNSLVAGQLAQQVVLKVTLPTGMAYAASKADRGPGCVLSGTTDLTCDLAFLSDQARVGHVLIWENVQAAGPHTLTAKVSAQQSETTLVDNTLTLTDSAPPAFTGTVGSKSTAGIPTGLNGTPTQTKRVDRVRPTTRAIASSAKRGKVAKIRFRIYDNSGVAKAIVTIRRGRKMVGHVSTGFGPVAAGGVYYVAWHVPKKLKPGRYTFTVVAADRAKHKSKPSHATFTVRR